MADAFKPVDLSPYLKDLPVVPWDEDDASHGQLPTTPITLTGTWDDGRHTCVLCGLRFTPTNNTLLTATSHTLGLSGPCCEACAVDHLVD